MNIKRTNIILYSYLYSICIVYVSYICVYIYILVLEMFLWVLPVLQRCCTISTVPGESASTAWISPWAAQVRSGWGTPVGSFWEVSMTFFGHFFWEEDFICWVHCCWMWVSLDSRCKKEVTAWGLNWKIWSRYFLSIPCMAWWGPLTTYIHN